MIAIGRVPEAVCMRPRFAIGNKIGISRSRYSGISGAVIARLAKAGLRAC